MDEVHAYSFSGSLPNYLQSSGKKTVVLAYLDKTCLLSKLLIPSSVGVLFKLLVIVKRSIQEREWVSDFSYQT